MSILEADNITFPAAVAKLIDASYSDEKLNEDIMALFYSSEFFRSKETSEIDDYLNKILSLVSSNVKIKNRSDLRVLTLSMEELNERIQIYHDFAEKNGFALKLPSCAAVAYDPKILTAKLAYCMVLNIPYFDDYGIILKDLTDADKSYDYFRNFHEILNSNFDINNTQDYYHTLSDVNKNEEAQIHGAIQRYTYVKYNTFAKIPSEVCNLIKESLLNDDNSKQDIIKTAYEKLKEYNDFIQEESYDEIVNLVKPKNTDDDYGTRRGHRG